MRTSCAINGFGRIGKNFLRSIVSDGHACERIDIRVINIGNGDRESVPYFFMYDTIMGRYPGAVSYDNGILTIDNQHIEIIAETDPEKLPWKRFGIQWVIDSSGAYTTRDRAICHIKAGAEKVLITAPTEGEDSTIIPGFNDELYDAQNHKIISLGSCTTNALFPLLNGMHQAFGVERAIVTTAHAYTQSQPLHDGTVSGGDPRRMRSAALNIVPASTGASRMVARLMPELAAAVVVRAIRVPVATVSLLEMALMVKKSCSVQDIHEAVEAASRKMGTILGISHAPLVSSDFRGDSRSIVVDATLTDSVMPLCHIAGWYDNEWGYSCRLRDFLVSVSK